MSAAYEQLAVDALEQIGATTARAQLDQVAQQAAAKSWSYSHFLGRLLEPDEADGARVGRREATTRDDPRAQPNQLSGGHPADPSVPDDAAGER